MYKKFLLASISAVILFTSAIVKSHPGHGRSSYNIPPPSATEIASNDNRYYRNTRYYKNRKRYNRNYNRKRYKKRAVAKRRISFPSTRPATGNRVFIFSPRQKAWAAYSADGRLIKTGAASGGKSYCADVGRSCLTPRGHFKVYRKGDASCKSSKYPRPNGGARMPYCMFFRGGYAIHGSSHVPNYNASHGCIRVRPSAAHWLHRNFIRHGTSVIVRPY